MRTNGQKKKEKIKQPEVRSLKVQFKTRFNTNSNKDVPEIRLCGNWLEKLGFHYGKKISVTTREKLLVIRLHPD
jgi:hypothetical protein